jgi:glycosyltransferase involved in cell wall biosynthesis
MKILLINKFYYLCGGAERYVQMWERVLRAKGHEVIPFAMADSRNWPSPYAEYFAWPVYFDMANSLTRKIKAGAHSIYSFAVRSQLAALIAATKPDIAHVNAYGYQLTPAIFAPLRAAGIPVAQTAHEYKHICQNQHLRSDRTGRICEKCRHWRYIAPIATRCIKGSCGAGAIAAMENLVDRACGLSRRGINRIIAPSNFMRDKMVEFGMNAERIQVVPNFVELADYAPHHPPGDYILFAGRLVAHKGVLTLLAAAEKLPRVVFKIAGDGPLRAIMEKQIAERKITNIAMLGLQSGAPLRALIENACAVAVPSEWYENCPLIILEAMAAGRAVIAGELGGSPELVADGVTGLLHAADRDSLVARISHLWNDRASAARMGAAGRRAAEERYAPRMHYNAVMGIYENLLALRKKTS